MKRTESLIFIISGPAGVGKTTLCNTLKTALGDSIATAITTTTRRPRAGEMDGRDYYFVDDETFQRLIREDAFLEYSVVHGRNFYGLTRREVDQHFLHRRHMLLNMDVQGLMKLRRLAKERAPQVDGRVISVFLMPPDIETLQHRLLMRASDSQSEIDRRLQSAVREMDSAVHYDYLLPSTSIEETLNCMLHIYWAELLRNRNSRSEISVGRMEGTG